MAWKAFGPRGQPSHLQGRRRGAWSPFRRRWIVTEENDRAQLPATFVLRSLLGIQVPLADSYPHSRSCGKRWGIQIKINEGRGLIRKFLFRLVRNLIWCTAWWNNIKNLSILVSPIISYRHAHNVTTKKKTNQQSTLRQREVEYNTPVFSELKTKYITKYIHLQKALYYYTS